MELPTITTNFGFLSFSILFEIIFHLALFFFFFTVDKQALPKKIIPTSSQLNHFPLLLVRSTFSLS